MKTLVAVLSESPFYFTMALPDRYRLVKRLMLRETGTDLRSYQMIVAAFLKKEDQSS